MASRLTSAFVKTAPLGKHADGNGLYLYVTKSSKQWVCRFHMNGKRREMGLGSANDVSLKDARDHAADAKQQVRKGLDPIRERQRPKITVFEDVARSAFEARKSELREDGKAGRWFSPITHHVLPKLGDRPIDTLDQHDLYEVIHPIWDTKADTARKALNRTAIIFKHAAALGLDVDLLAIEKAKALLGKSRHKPQNIPAMPYAEVPAFYQSLDDGLGPLALKMLILTGVRSKPLRLMRLDQIDGDIWTIPGERMKGLKDRTDDYRVPLSSEAMRVLEKAKKFTRDGYVFASPKRGVLSDATMSRLMERRGLEARPHGFRSSLRTWLQEQTDAPFEVAETMLSHKVGQQAWQAYYRSDLLDQRRHYLEQWGRVCAP